MKKLSVQTAKPYEILLGSGLLNIPLAQLLPFKGGKVFIVTDEHVAPLYLSHIVQLFRAADFVVSSVCVPAGEDSKSLESYAQLLTLFAAKGLTRGDTVVALGGGVVGDLAGFAAATYLRGIRFVSLPTSLLAMVDASVGGKTAVNLPTGKNLVGAFHQPALVLCDYTFLDTLPEAEKRTGCAEILKTAILFDKELFAMLCKAGMDFDAETVIPRCVEWKRDLVCADEFDCGNRQLLNLGHTVGHAIERCSGYTISHGCAVAIGICVMARCFASDAAEIEAAFRLFGLPTETDFSVDELMTAVLHDKKRSGDTLTLAVPYRVGACALLQLSIEDFAQLLAKGLRHG